MVGGRSFCTRGQMCEQVVDGRTEPDQIDRLGKEGKADQLRRLPAPRVAAHQHQGDVRLQIPRLAGHLHAIQPGHRKIGDQEIGPFGLQRGQRADGIRERAHLTILGVQGLREQLGLLRIVVHHEDEAHQKEARATRVPADGRDQRARFTWAGGCYFGVAVRMPMWLAPARLAMVMISTALPR